MEEIEKKIKSILDFLERYVRTFFLIFAPPVFIRKILYDESKIASPVSFLSVGSFFSVKSINFLLLSFAISFNSCRTDNIATQSKVEELTLKHIFLIPTIDEIIYLTVPFIVFVYFLSRGVDYLSNKFKIHSVLKSSTIIIYQASILLHLVIILSIAFSSTILSALYLVMIIIGLVSVVYLYLLLKNNSVNYRHKRSFWAISKIFFYSVLINVFLIAGLGYIIYMFIDEKEFKNERYFRKDLVELSVLKSVEKPEGKEWQIAIKSNDNFDVNYLLVPDSNNVLLSYDSTKVGHVLAYNKEIKLKPGQMEFLTVSYKITDSSTAPFYIAFSAIEEKTFKRLVIVSQLGFERSDSLDLAGMQ